MAGNMKVQVEIGVLDRYSKEIKRFERELRDLDRWAGGSRSGDRLGAAYSRRADEMARQMHRVAEQRRDIASSTAMMSTGGLGMTAGVLGPAALAYGAKEALVSYAAVERAVGRIGVTAGASAEEVRSAMGAIDKAAIEYATTQASVTEGLDTLVSAGRSMQDAMSFLPSVTATAQAAGAEVRDIAATADAVGRNFGVTGANMQNAFDIMVAGGKAGMFELKDMASYLPSLAPAFSALGYSGEKGLAKLITMLQVLRSGAGTSSEAATNAANIFAKIESEETANKFEKMGVDLRKEMAKARREGRDLLDFFVELTDKTIGGDLSKLPLLFGDMQMGAGMRSLITGGEQATQVMGELGKAAGSTAKDLERVLGDSQAKIDKLSANWTRFKNNLGSNVAVGANPALDAINAKLEDVDAYRTGLTKQEAEGATKDEVREEYDRRYSEANPDYDWYSPADRRARSRAFVDDVQAYGRGDAASPYANLDRIIDSRRTQRFPSQADGEAASRALLDRQTGNIDGGQVRRGEPVPSSPPSRGVQMLSDAEQRAEYGRGRQLAEEAVRRREADRPLWMQGDTPDASYVERKRAQLAEITGNAQPATSGREGRVTAPDPARFSAPLPPLDPNFIERLKADAARAAANLGTSTGAIPLPMFRPEVDTTAFQTGVSAIEAAKAGIATPVMATADMNIAPLLSKVEQAKAAVRSLDAMSATVGAGNGANFNARVRDQF